MYSEAAVSTETQQAYLYIFRPCVVLFAILLFGFQSILGLFVITGLRKRGFVRYTDEYPCASLHRDGNPATSGLCV